MSSGVCVTGSSKAQNQKHIKWTSWNKKELYVQDTAGLECA